MISFFNKIHFSNSVTPCLVEKEIEERKKKIIACLIQKKKRKKKEKWWNSTSHIPTTK